MSAIYAGLIALVDENVHIEQNVMKSDESFLVQNKKLKLKKY